MSFAHEYFHEKRPETGNLRWCKLCAPEQPALQEVQAAVEAGKNLSREFLGAIQNDGSTSAMVNHLRAKHEDVLPEGIGLKRKASAEESEMRPRDKTMCRDWVEHMLFAALEPARLVESKHAKAVLVPRLGPLPSRKEITREADRALEDIRQEVSELVQAAVDAGAKFTLSADTWKPKAKRRRHYLAMYLNFVSPAWTPVSLCAGVVEAPPPRTGRQFPYRKEFYFARANGVFAFSGEIRKQIRASRTSLYSAFPGIVGGHEVDFGRSSRCLPTTSRRLELACVDYSVL